MEFGGEKGGRSRKEALGGGPTARLFVVCVVVFVVVL